MAGRWAAGVPSVCPCGMFPRLRRAAAEAQDRWSAGGQPCLTDGGGDQDGGDDKDGGDDDDAGDDNDGEFDEEKNGD